MACASILSGSTWPKLLTHLARKKSTQMRFRLDYEPHGRNVCSPQSGSCSRPYCCFVPLDHVGASGHGTSLRVKRHSIALSISLFSSFRWPSPLSSRCLLGVLGRGFLGCSSLHLCLASCSQCSPSMDGQYAGPVSGAGKKLRRTKRSTRRRRQGVIKWKIDCGGRGMATVMCRQ